MKGGAKTHDVKKNAGPLKMAGIFLVSVLAVFIMTPFGSN
jgi:hypothetical protein